MHVPHLQLRDLPEPVHEALRRRARRCGVSMREYVLRLIEADLGATETHAELVERLRSLPTARDAPAATTVLARERRARADRLAARDA